VSEAVSGNWNFNFRRWLDPHLQVHWCLLRDNLATVALRSEQDKPRWKFTKKGKFSMKLLYEKLSAVVVDRANMA
jgi:hypothetical protein